ncbi:MAG TPA: hypothetical protein VK763_02055 [Terriglobales bacterium]|nr:hypothetical protein [Terriglobales bacterium]
MTARSKFRLWLAETHSPQFELVRHFLSEQLANDLVSSDQVRRLVITVLAVLGCVGPLIVRLYRPKYTYLQELDTGDLYLAAVRADRLFFISLSMIVAGLVTVIQWQSLFPSRQDYLALKPLPVRFYQIFAARFLSAFVILMVVIADLNLATSVLFPLLTSGRWQSPSFGIRYVLAHGVATFSAGLFAFFAVGVLQGVLMNILPTRMFERFSVLIQAVLAMTFLAVVPYVLDIPNWYATIAARPHWMTLFPPAWFLGLYETLLGAPDKYFVQLREIALMATTAAMFIALATYFLCYRRHASRVLEQALPKSSGASPVERSMARLLRIVLKPFPEQAVFVFAIQTLRRSRQHKFVIGFCFALALLLALPAVVPSSVAHFRSHESWSIGELEPILAAPLVMGAVLISALCYVFQLPSEARAAWVFRMAENAGRRDLLASVESLLVVCGIVPVLLLTAPLEVFALGWILAFAHLELVAVLLLLLIELRLIEWHKIPFTCSYVPGRRNFWQTMGIYLLLFAILIPTITFFEARLLRPLILLACSAALCVIYFFSRSARRTRWAIVPLLFDESDEPLVGGVRLIPE